MPPLRAINSNFVLPQKKLFFSPSLPHINPKSAQWSVSILGVESLTSKSSFLYPIRMEYQVVNIDPHSWLCRHFQTYLPQYYLCCNKIWMGFSNQWCNRTTIIYSSIQFRGLDRHRFRSLITRGSIWYDRQRSTLSTWFETYMSPSDI